MAYTLVQTTASLIEMLEKIVDLPANPPSIYIDLEGVKLSRSGAIAVLQIFVLPLKHMYLVDVHQLKGQAFICPSADGTTLKSVLENDSIPKVIFDVRHDSDALFGQYEVALQGIHDLQVMEFARAGRHGKHVNGLARCIERDAQLNVAERKRFADTKVLGTKLFAPEHGGSYEVFLARPLAPGILKYCVQDVQYLPRLWEIYSKQLSAAALAKVETEVVDRIWMSQQPLWAKLGKGRHMAIGPWQSGGLTRTCFPKESNKAKVPKFVVTKQGEITTVVSPLKGTAEPTQGILDIGELAI